MKKISLYFFSVHLCFCRWILLDGDRRANLIKAIDTSFSLIPVLPDLHSRHPFLEALARTTSPSFLYPLIIMNEAAMIKASDWSATVNSTDPDHSFAFTDSLRQPTRQATFIGAILAFVFIIIGLIGNIILITAILSVKKLRSNIINIFIVSVCDDIRGQRNDVLMTGSTLTVHLLDSKRIATNSLPPRHGNEFLVR